MRILKGDLRSLSQGKVWAGGPRSNLVDLIIPDDVIVVRQGDSIEIKVGDGVNVYNDLPNLTVQAEIGFNVTHGDALPSDEEGNPGDVYFMTSNAI